jgi:hypothetical protein
MNKFDWNSAVFWICVWICVTIIIVAFTFNLKDINFKNNELYYDAYNKCIESGGSFIPSRGTNEVTCIMGKK